MSGGVDSSVAAALLVEQGYDVVGLFMSMRRDDTSDGRPSQSHRPACCGASDATDARLVAGRLGIPFFALNFKQDFDKLIAHFAAEYARGRTPNPCILCNEQLKFGRLYQYAHSIGASLIATGHYARVTPGDGYPCLLRAHDRRKDQSYVLFAVGAPILSRTRFPIGELTKDQVRREAERLHLPVHDKPESSDICFAPDRDYARIVRTHHPEAFQSGNVRDATGRVVGRHEGIGHFTIGQRHGLGIAMGVPHYVTGIDVTTNEVTIGGREHLMRGGLVADGVRWLIDPPVRPIRARIQIRYSHEAVPGLVEPMTDGTVRARFETPQAAVTPGQAAVFYVDDRVLGGGWINRSLDVDASAV